MNNKRRAKLRDAIDLLSRAADIVSDAAQEENDYADNMPENMQEGDKYDKAIEAAEMLEETEELIGEAIDKIDRASE